MHTLSDVERRAAGGAEGANYNSPAAPTAPPAISPARGVLVSVAVTDAEGDVYDPRKQLINKAVRVNSQGYAILGAFLGVERTLQFSPRPGSLSPMRPDIYTLSSSRRAQGPVPKLVRSVQGLTQETLEVAGSRVMLHFSAAEYSAIGNGFQMLWTAVPKEDSSSWFDTRTATIVFSCLAGAAYTIAAIAAWKWYRQRVERQAEEARRAAAREEQRNLRRRHRQEGHRRRRARGLPLELVSRLPTSSIKLSELEPDAGGEEPMCTICLCEYEEGEKVTWLPCSHSYHTECVTSWLKSSLTCPICKDNVKRSLLKTLSMYRELHRGGGLPADLEGGTGTDTDDYGSGRLGVASGSASAQPPAIEMSALHLE
eukprot:jgi/Tetstr1/457885/TSEL_044404.t1